MELRGQVLSVNHKVMRISLRDAALFRRFNHRRQLKLLLSMIGSHAVDASYHVIGTGAMRLILRIIM